MAELYLEDFTVGQTFGSGRVKVDTEQIKAFAAEFDPQPFHLDEGGHVAARAVLRLQRAVVFLDHQLADIVHEAGVALHLGIDGKVLGEDEMQVAVQGVPENDRLVVAVLIEKRLKVQRRGGQILDPDNGKVYRSTVRLTDNGKKLNVRGYIGVPMLGRSQTWVRQE